MAGSDTLRCGDFLAHSDDSLPSECCTWCHADADAGYQTLVEYQHEGRAALLCCVVAERLEKQCLTS